MPFTWESPEDESDAIEQSDDAQLIFTVTATEVDDAYYSSKAFLVVSLEDPLFAKDESETRELNEDPGQRIGLFRFAEEEMEGDDWKKHLAHMADSVPNAEDFVVGKEHRYELGEFKETGQSVKKAIILKTGRALARAPAYSGVYKFPCRIEYTAVLRKTPTKPGKPVAVSKLIFTVQPD